MNREFFLCFMQPTSVVILEDCVRRLRPLGIFFDPGTFLRSKKDSQRRSLRNDNCISAVLDQTFLFIEPHEK
jgi:hypothetical protein